MTAAVPERHPDRSLALCHDILELSPFGHQMGQVTVEADELGAAGGPMQLLAGER